MAVYLEWHMVCPMVLSENNNYKLKIIGGLKNVSKNEQTICSRLLG